VDRGRGRQDDVAILVLKLLHVKRTRRGPLETRLGNVNQRVNDLQMVFASREGNVACSGQQTSTVTGVVASISEMPANPVSAKRSARLAHKNGEVQNKKELNKKTSVRTSTKEFYFSFFLFFSFFFLLV
jgi:hypothetical protein